MPIPDTHQLQPPQRRMPQLRPSRYKLAEQLYLHARRLRDDRSYAASFATFVRELPDEPSERPRGRRVRASGIKDCARQQAFRLMGAPEHQPEGQPQWALAAAFGEQLHTLIERWLQFLGVSSRSEFLVDNGVLRGRVDHLLDGGPVLGPAVLDVKTVGAKDFRSGPDGYKIPGYVAQLTVYGHLLNVPLGVVLLVNRDSGELADYEVDIDPAYAAQLLERADLLVRSAEQRQLPAAEQWSGSEGSFACQNFCPYYGLCTREQRTGEIQLSLDTGTRPEDL